MLEALVVLPAPVLRDVVLLAVRPSFQRKAILKE
jgi:hypothetical protein